MGRFDKLLVLDLDETLVHACEEPLGRGADFEVGPYLVYERPGVRDFLEQCLAEYREVAVWTASTLSYAIPVVERIVDTRSLSFIWGRERCTYHVDWETRDAVFLKDLKKLRRKGYDVRKILAVDDTPRKFRRSYGNYIRIRAFEGDPADAELPALLDYLRELGPAPNVRAIEKRGWRSRF